MREAIRKRRSDRSPVGVLRATLAGLGFGMESAAQANAEQWTTPSGRLSVTIVPSNSFTPAEQVAHHIGNLRVFELPPGATVDNRFMRLSPTELSILLTLARAQRHFVDFPEVARSGKAGRTLSLGALSVHVHGLRRKLAAHRASARITTRRASGYMLTAADDDRLPR
jgi:DNA-binding response OmpR family regulator